MIDFQFKTGRKEIQTFARALPLALVVWGVVLGWKHHWGGQAYFWFFGVALLLFLWGRLWPGGLKPVYFGWMVVTRGLAWLVTTAVLGLIFYLGFTPIGLLMRLLGKDTMRRKLDRGAPSYWLKRGPRPFDPAHYDRQF